MKVMNMRSTLSKREKVLLGSGAGSAPIPDVVAPKEESNGSGQLADQRA
jgi:hypothetical protein